MGMLDRAVALACIEASAKEVPEAVVGAGTVRSASDAQAAALAGARFAVSPGYTHGVGKACHYLGLARLASQTFVCEFLVLFEQCDLLLFLVVLELHSQLRDFADAVERALFAHASQVFTLVGECRRVVADGSVRA